MSADCIDTWTQCYSNVYGEGSKCSVQVQHCGTRRGFPKREQRKPLDLNCNYFTLCHNLNLRIVACIEQRQLRYVTKYPPIATLHTNASTDYTVAYTALHGTRYLEVGASTPGGLPEVALVSLSMQYPSDVPQPPLPHSVIIGF